MKRIALGAVLLAAIVSGPALAADLRVKAPVYTKAPAAPSYSWTGCYLGIEGGGVWGRSQQYAADPTDALAGVLGDAQTGGISPTGGMIGGTVGCNYQVSNFVLGIEGDDSWTNNSGSANLIAPFRTTDVVTTNETWVATYRGRIGYAWDRVLLYGTGGGAATNIGVNLCDPTFGCVASSQTVYGWAAGGGIEYAVWQNLSVKIEYLHLDFGTSNFGRLMPTPGFTFLARNVSLTDDILRLGLNYRLNLAGYP
jgi:outer membrane immunogenic protein